MRLIMDSKESKKFRAKVIKDMRAKPAKPGDLLTSKRRPSKRTVAVLGLI